MERNPYVRTCPRCKGSFRAVTERGICPKCGLFSAIRRDGTFVATRPLRLDLTLDGDEQFGDGPLAGVHAAVAYGGGPLVKACRYERYPSVAACHDELRREFHRLWSLLEAEIPDARFAEVNDPFSHRDWAGTEYDRRLSF